MDGERQHHQRIIMVGLVGFCTGDAVPTAIVLYGLSQASRARRSCPDSAFAAALSCKAAIIV